MTDREAFVSRLILEAETPLERAAVTELQIAGLKLQALAEQLAAHQSVSIEEAGDAISATFDADIRMGSPWVKPDPAEATAAVVASVKNLEDLLGELERLRAIVRDLAESNPYEGEYGMCVLCLTDPPSIAENVSHAPGCPWLRATQEAETTK